MRLLVRLKPLPAKKVSSASSSGCLPESTRKPPSFMQQRPQTRWPLCYQNSQALVNSRVTSSLPQPIRLPILRGPCVQAVRLEKSRPAENNRTEADVGMVTMRPARRPPHILQERSPDSFGHARPHVAFWQRPVRGITAVARRLRTIVPSHPHNCDQPQAVHGRHAWHKRLGRQQSAQEVAARVSLDCRSAAVR